MSRGIVLEDLAYAWPGREPLWTGLSLEVGPGEVCAVLGPSGVGKSTLLRVVAGLLAPTRGAVHLPRPGTGRRATALVFQDPRLLPWETVQGNLRFALEAAGIPRAESAARIARALEAVELPGIGDLRPRELSGGMAQRVGLARALCLQPHALLLDEPFAALDPLLRERLRGVLRHALRADDAAVILVTHDVEEAIDLGDRVVVLGGRPARWLLALDRTGGQDERRAAVRAALRRALP